MSREQSPPRRKRRPAPSGSDRTATASGRDATGRLSGDLGAVFDKARAGEQSTLLKIGGAAVATPLALLWAYFRARRRGGGGQPDWDLATGGLILLAAVPAGAVLGSLLVARDVVLERKAAGRPVSLPFNLLFGYGLVSVLLVWFPLIVVATLVVTLLTLDL